MKACTRQPTGLVQLNWGSPLLSKVQYVLLGSQRFWNPMQRSITRTPLSVAATSRGVGPLVANGGYETVPHVTATGGTSNWTIAGLFCPPTVPTSTANPLGNFLVGMCEAPFGSSYDRCIGAENTTQRWRVYLYDGNLKTASSTATATAGRTDSVIGTTDGSNVYCSVGGYADVSSGVLNNGYNAYTSAEFCVGAPANSGAWNLTAIPLLLFTLGYWNASLRAMWHDNPWQIFAEPSWLYTGMGSGSWTPLEVTG